MPSLLIAHPFAIVSKIAAALLATLAVRLGCPLAVMGEISTGRLTTLAFRLSCALRILWKIGGTAGTLGFRISHRLIPLSSGYRSNQHVPADPSSPSKRERVQSVRRGCEFLGSCPIVWQNCPGDSTPVSVTFALGRFIFKGTKVGNKVLILC